MKNLFTMRLFIAFTYAILLGLWSCADQPEDFMEETFSVQSNKTKSIENAVYHERTNSWIVPQKDPYTLANFQKAYDNLASNRSVQKLSNGQTSEFTNTQKLEATHYSLKIFPKNEKEQWKIELMKDVKVAYTPFDYVPLSEADAQKLTSARSAVNIYPEESRFTVTYDDMETTDGPAETVTYTMPVLYAVWPCNKPLPEDMTYEIDYEVFIPDYTEATKGSSRLSTDAMQALESEAISLALGKSAYNTTTTKGPVGPKEKTGTISYYDHYLNKLVPQVNLKQRFQIGSRIWDVYTDSNGFFTMPGPFPADATYSHVFLHERWKITWENSTIPFMVTWGMVSDYWNPETTISLSPTSSIPVYEIHPAVDYYYHGSHAIQAWYYDSGIRIEAIGHSGNGTLGTFIYSKNSNAYIKIYNDNQQINNRLIGTVLHELGHFTHYGERGGYKSFNAVHDLIAESFASYVGWHIGESYYKNLGYTPTALEDLTNQSRQYWKKTYDNKSYYSPMFVDLIDDYNQGQANSSYNYDPIKYFPHSIIRTIAAEYSTWNSLKTKLKQYVGVYYTSEELNSYIAPYDYWFVNQ